MPASSITTETTGPSILDIRPLNDRTKEEYRNSFGTLVGTVGPFGRWHVWNAVDKVNVIWSELESQIVDLLKAKACDVQPPRRYRGPKEPSHALRCYMVGLKQERASPHVAIICGQKWFCSQIRDIILTSGLLQDRGWAGFLKLQGEIRQPGRASPSPSETPKSGESIQHPNMTVFLHADKYPESLCGTRITVSAVDGRIVLATLGGVIELDEQRYGLTVSHAFLSNKLEFDSVSLSSRHDLESTESEAESDSDASSFAFDEDDLDPFIRPPLRSTESSDTQIERPQTAAAEVSSTQPADSRPASSPISPPWLQRSFSQLRRTPTGACNNCKQASVMCDGARPVCYRCTRRNIQSSCDYDLSAKHEKSFASTTHGEPQSHWGQATGRRVSNERLEAVGADPYEDASRQMTSFEPSALGSLRWTLGSLKTFENAPALDFEWALVSTKLEDLANAGNIRKVATDGFIGELRVTSIAHQILAGSDVFLVTPTGTAPAKGIGSESMIKFSSSGGYSRVWTVQLDLTEDGDCGSWAVNSNSELLGMLIGCCDVAREAYILPARTIFAEIGTTSRKSVSLPSLEQVKKPKQSEGADSTTTEFAYSPLQRDEIRILTLMPGEADAPVECHLAVYNLKQSVEYEALSHVWDLSGTSSRMKLDQHFFYVKYGLISALKVLRYTAKPRYLWVDAICINSNDTLEMNTQAALMARIMSRATNVCVWLGDEDESSVWAFSPSIQILNLDHLDRLMENESTVQHVLALCALAQRNWFHRRWPFQEICLAKRAILLCGKYTMPWNTFADTVSLLRAHEDQSQAISDWFIRQNRQTTRNPSADLVVLSTFVEIVSSTTRLTKGGRLEPTFPLEYLVSALSWLNVSIPHDLIYPLLSLAKDTQPLNAFSPKRRTAVPDKRDLKIPSFHDTLQVTLQRRPSNQILIDYDRPFAEVCKDYTATAIHTSKSLDVICRPWAVTNLSLPSWVATAARASVIMQKNRQFVRVNADELVGRGRPGRSRIYDASGQTQPTFHFTDYAPEESALCVEGFVLDTIDTKQSSALMGNIPGGWTDFLGWTNTSTDPPEELWRLLVADRDSIGNPPPIFYRVVCAKVFQQIEPSHGLHIATKLTAAGAVEKQFLLRVQSVVWGRRLMRTSSHNLIGLVPEETKKRDMIAILHGCSVPVVLRRVEEHSGSLEEAFKLVAEDAGLELCSAIQIMRGVKNDAPEDGNDKDIRLPNQ